MLHIGAHILLLWHKRKIIYYIFINHKYTFKFCSKMRRYRVRARARSFVPFWLMCVCTSILFVAAHVFFFSFNSDAKTMQNDFRHGNSLNFFCDYYKKIKIYCGICIYCLGQVRHIIYNKYYRIKFSARVVHSNSIGWNGLTLKLRYHNYYIQND